MSQAALASNNIMNNKEGLFCVPPTSQFASDLTDGSTNLRADGDFSANNHPNCSDAISDESKVQDQNSKETSNESRSSPNIAPILIDNAAQGEDHRNSPKLDSIENSIGSKLGAPTKDTFFRFGPYVPIIKDGDEIIIDPKGMISDLPVSHPHYDPQNDRFTCEILPDDSIIEAPSLVTPLLLKKRTFWPPIECFKYQISNGVQSTESEKEPTEDNSSDDVQVIKVVKKSRKVRNNCRSTDDYIKSATLSSLTNSRGSNGNGSLLAIEDYYESSAGQMLLAIGLSQVMEFVLEIDMRKLAREVRRDPDDCVPLKKRLETLKMQVAQMKLSNQIFKAKPSFVCPRCPFTSGFSTVIEAHLEEPHMNSRREYLCNYCSFKVRDYNQVVFHYVVHHNRKCRFERPPEAHSCRNCPFECRSKKQMTSHAAYCERVFPHNTFLAPASDSEALYPGVTAKPITKDDVEAYERTIKALRLAAYNPHQLKISKTYSGSKSQNTPVLLLKRPNKPGTSNDLGADESQSDASSLCENISSTSSAGKNPLTTREGWSVNNSINSNTHNNSNQIMRILSAQGPPSDQTRVYDLQHPRPQSSFRNGLSVIKTVSDIVMRPDGVRQKSIPSRDIETGSTNRIKISLLGQGSQPVNPHDTSASSSNPSLSKQKSNTFVICEICDGYIKDLNQLKSHMQCLHKVKIHPRMLESRPPLNCQKCQWRFFTDQGLERHLLGAHGLVTSNMQELVDSGTDSGRCTVCGRAHASRLVAHMREVHKMFLKPAHLSYKCTVCSANFNLYRLFENHVYSVHSDSVKRTSDG